MRIRPARASDLRRITEIWCLADGLPMMGEPYALHRHELDTATLLVAERDRLVVGFGSVVRSDVGTFLADLFVDPDAQSSGVGRTLLAALLDGGGAGARWTVASDDERALARYVRAGFTPRWPVYALAGPVDALAGAPGEAALASTTAPLETIEVGLDELPLDKGAGTPVVRPADRAYWASLDAVAWLVRRAGENLGAHDAHDVVGYGIALPHCRWHPVSDAVRIGPVVAFAPQDACAVVAALWSAVIAHLDRAETVRMFVPGPHPALHVALERGQRITSVTTFCSSDPARLDPTRVLIAPDLT